MAPGVSLPISNLTGICLGFLLFLVIRPFEGMGYTYLLTVADVGTALLALIAFAIVGIPLGIVMGFIQPGLALIDPVGWTVKLVAIYFLTAVPEELLFRGIIQNLLELRFGRTIWTLVIASIIFGLAHIDNVTAHQVPPNIPYAIMATFAAWRTVGPGGGEAKLPLRRSLTAWQISFGMWFSPPRQRRISS